MKIQPLNSTFFEIGKNINNPHHTITFGQNSAKTSSVQTNPADIDKIQTEEIRKLKKDVQKYPADINYRKQLLVNAGMSPDDYYKIRSIIGKDEIQDIISDFNEHKSFYKIGRELLNIKNAETRANLHIHTQASDGFLTVEELLKKASNYANFVAKNNPKAKDEPFVIAITDHDTTEGAAEAIKVISENPLKYKNLRVILGVEMTTFDNIGTNIINKPTNTHILVYGLDPNEKTFKNFIETTKQNKHNIANLMTEDANKAYQKVFGQNNFYNIEQAKNYAPPLKKGILGFYNYMSEFFETKFAINNIVLKDNTIINNLKKHNLPTTTDRFLEEMRKFYYPQNHNNVIGSPKKTIPEFLAKTTNMNKEDVEKILQNGLQLPEAQEFKKSLSAQTDKYKITLTPQYNYMPDFKKLNAGLDSQPNVLVGIAHPLDTVKKIPEMQDQFHFLNSLYRHFVVNFNLKAKFTEVYYQSYDEAAKNLGKFKITKQFLNLLSKIHNLSKTGGIDTHRTNIFKRYF